MKKVMSKIVSVCLIIALLSGLAIVVQAKDNRLTVTYHSGKDDSDSYTVEYDKSYNNSIQLEAYYKNYAKYEDVVFAYWSLNDKESSSSISDNILFFDESKSEIDVYAHWCPVTLKHSEIYSFADSERKYSMTKSDFKAMEKNFLRNYFLGPLPGALVATVMSIFPLFKFHCCFGFNLSIALQHLGKIDLLSEQGVNTVSELKETELLKSHLNYYLAQCVSNILFMNSSINPGTDLYKRNVKAMYESVKDGNLVMLCGKNKDVFKIFHSILLCGAYEDEQENRYVIVYDSSHPDRYATGEGKMKISADYSTMETRAFKGTIDAFGWYSDFSQFDSFKIDGTGDTKICKKAMKEHWKYYFENIYFNK